MTTSTHLKSLQALELAIREGSLRQAAQRLNITPAAIGQRIRSLEDYLGTDLLVRGRSGLKPTAELTTALDDLQLAFAALQRVTDSLDFQRVSEIHIVADPDWAELWLAPRLSTFRELHPNILFCINGSGDVPLRIGTPDIKVSYGDTQGEELFRDVFLPVTGPDNPRRIAKGDPVLQMEGMPLLHLSAQQEKNEYPGWVEWFKTYPYRETGLDRGVRYKHTRHALEAVRQNVGFLVCGLSLVLPNIEEGSIVAPFPMSHYIDAPFPYRFTLRTGAEKRPQIQRFIAWLHAKANDTQNEIQKLSLIAK
ncbi:LysR family transcriptional regulator [uncultured Paraglaciecola sp.]|uniref:LysR family transcriptional regulator n=1 Tax=uncultured Paraglaciecola sp. TaxID=1765024 RepID=UPI00260A96E7|nr:LysR family transcriptional regulator [uncultured Paraglaciecola sp.]